ncbi:MAG: hypothetical protein HMLKMBBP_01821 [Planctomycetes bacterium]|nr:hypothetical protein [Planctomycetota bacterium]
MRPSRWFRRVLPTAALAAAVHGGGVSASEPLTAPGWTFESLGPGGDWNSLAVDPSGAAHAAWFDEDDLIYATNASGKWVGEVVTTPPEGYGGTYSAAIAVDGEGLIHIAYDGTGRLMHASGGPGAWTHSTVDDPGFDIGDDVSMDLDGAGAVHIAYLDRQNGRLRYATNAGGTWSVTPLGNGGYMASIDVDGDGAVHIAHSDWRGGNRCLYTSDRSGSWMTDILGASAGYRASVRAAGDGNIHVAWYDGRVLHARNAGEGWSTVEVDGAVQTASNTSMAVDSHGKVHITYGEYGEGDLRYATNASGAWVWFPVETDGDKGFSSSLAIDGDGMLHVLYTDRDAYRQRYATTRRTAACKAVAARDGWIRETAEGAGSGRARNSAAATLAAGDDAANCQVRGFLSFDTRRIPEGAVIAGARLRLTRKPAGGGDPFESLGRLVVDVGGPLFGSSPNLKPEDFDAEAAVESAAELVAGNAPGVFEARLDAQAAAQIAGGGGVVQFRIRFETPTDADGTADRVLFFSGSGKPASRRPSLEVIYRLP